LFHEDRKSVDLRVFEEEEEVTEGLIPPGA